MTRLALIFIQNQWFSLNVDNFDDYNESLILTFNITLITFQSPELIRELKNNRGISHISDIIDIESLDKQMSQEGKDLRPYDKWSMLAALKYHKIAESNFQLTNSTIKECLEYMARLYLELIEKDANETVRFNGIERKINNIIYRRQVSGIRIDTAIAQRLCADLEKSIYRTKNILQTQYRIFNPDHEGWQKQYLDKKGYTLIKSPLFTFKVRRNDDEICMLLYEMIRNQRDLDSLLYMQSHWGGKDHAHPKYLGFGTITSRITMRDPSFQNLRKSNRKVVIADDWFKLLYIDYSQFEAGILASLSGDQKLIKLYNTDIYKDLAEKVLGDGKKRSDAKVIFYRYMYGDTTLSPKAMQYFTAFKDLQNYKARIDQEMADKSKIGTVEANFRHRGDEEVTWALSHVIQSTASLIYKRAVIRVFSEVNQAKFLIPMHDGTVYQIYSFWYDRLKPKIEQIYIEEFEKMCPNIKGQVKCIDVFE